MIKAINVSINLNGEIESIQEIIDNTVPDCNIDDIDFNDDEMESTMTLLGFNNAPINSLTDNHNFDMEFFQSPDFNAIGHFNPEVPNAMDIAEIFDEIVDLTEDTPQEINNQQYDAEIDFAISNELNSIPSNSRSLLSFDELDMMLFNNDDATIVENNAEMTKASKVLEVKTRKRGPYKKRERIPKAFICPHCPIISKSNYALELHVKTVHMKEKEHKCRTCNKSFGRIGHLKAHEAIHYNKEKTFECITCHSMFKSSASLSMHQNMHKAPKFICNLCEKGFHSNYQLKQHMNSHEGSLNYECKICDNKYVSLAMLKMHLKSHVTKKLECACCFKQLKSSQALKCHLIKNHSDIDENAFKILINSANNLTYNYELLEYVNKY